MNKSIEKELDDYLVPLVVDAFGDWGAFVVSTRNQNPLPDGSHITKKYVKRLKSFISTHFVAKKDVSKDLDSMFDILSTSSDNEMYRFFQAKYRHLKDKYDE